MGPSCLKSVMTIAFQLLKYIICKSPVSSATSEFSISILSLSGVLSSLRRKWQVGCKEADKEGVTVRTTSGGQSDGVIGMDRRARGRYVYDAWWQGRAEMMNIKYCTSKYRVVEHRTSTVT